MKNLPLWMGLAAGKAIFFAAVAETVLKITNSPRIMPWVGENSLAGGLPRARAGGLRLDGLAGFNLSKLHPASVAFIFAEALDLLTTMIGLLVINGIWEANPIVGLSGWTQAILLKTAVVLFVVAGIERMRRPLKIGSFALISGNLPKLVWIVPLVAGLPVVWNSLVILLEVAA